jgi:hypothetical protein
MLIDREMHNSAYGMVGRKRLFMFVVESLQNLAKHTDFSDMSDMSMVVYSKTDEGYMVTTGNVISSENVEELRKRLEEINKLDPDDIRRVYRQMLGNTVFSEKGGAGLGLIEMARKTGNKLDFDFLKIDDDKSYFILSKSVNSEGIGLHAGENEKPFRGEFIEKLERMMSKNNIYLIWSGHITPDVGKEVVTFTEKRLDEENIEQSLRRRVFSILVEMIENVAKYSPGREEEIEYGIPVALVRFKHGRYHISTGNLIRNSKIDVLEQKMDIIKKLDSAELKEHFRNSLLHQNEEVESTGNMGLIDMAWKSGNKLYYQLQPVNEIYSYFTITARIDGQIL